MASVRVRAREILYLCRLPPEAVVLRGGETATGAPRVARGGNWNAGRLRVKRERASVGVFPWTPWKALLENTEEDALQWGASLLRAVQA